MTLGQPLALSGPVTSSGTRAAGSAFDGSVMWTHTGGGGERDQGLPEAETEFQTFWLLHTQPVLCITRGPRGRSSSTGSFIHSLHSGCQAPSLCAGPGPCRLQLTVSSGDTPQIGPQRPTPRPSCLPFRESACWSLCQEGPFSPSPQTSRCDHASLSTPQASCLLAEFPVTVQAPLLFPATCFSVSPTDWDLPRQGPAFVSWHPCRPWPGKTPITFFVKLG